MSDALVAVCSRSFSEHPGLRDRLQRVYPRARFNTTGRVLADDELVAFLDGCEKAVVAMERIDGPVLDRLPALRVLSKYGVGLDGLDLQALAQRGIRVGWTGGVNRRAVAELVVSCAIALLRRWPEMSLRLREGEWSRALGRELGSATVGILGCGQVGKEVVRLLQPFHCPILVHDIRDYPDFYAAHAAVPVPLDVLLERSDVVSVHLPLDGGTRRLLDARALSRMKPGAMLINTARGHLVDEDALLACLVSGRLGGAAVDVFSQEPGGHPGLARHPRVIATPHLGGSTEEAILAMGEAAIRGLDDHRPATETVP